MSADEVFGMDVSTCSEREYVRDQRTNVCKYCVLKAQFARPIESQLRSLSLSQWLW